MTCYHPHPDDQGRPVVIQSPSLPTPLEHWLSPQLHATVVPQGALPPALAGIAFDPWHDVPASDAGWASVPGQAPVEEPAFILPPGKAAAAGVVIEEDDGRIWLVAPSNQFGGYQATFPKGRVETGFGLQASAIREAFEESGLRVTITGFLADSLRSQTYTRYYRARRVGGTPAAMGWETQAVHLVPRARLAEVAVHANDQPLIALLRK